MANFSHLKLVSRLNGTAKSKTGRRKYDPRTLQNLKDKKTHGQTLESNISSISKSWASELKARKQKGLPDLPNPKVIPIYLQIDPNLINIEFLKGFGIEIISEEDDGYIIGASVDAFRSLSTKIDHFVNSGKAINISDLMQIVEGNIWRRDLILSEELNNRWDTIDDTEDFLLEIGIACYLKISEEPVKKTTETLEKFNARHKNWLIRWREQSLNRDNLIDARTDLLKNFIKPYNGEVLTDDFVSFDDSFCCRIKINGMGLKDLVNNFQFVFEVSEAEQLSVSPSEGSDMEILEAEISPPDENSPTICVIDSGILEGHKLLRPSIALTRSKSYVPGDSSVIDAVKGGGHGTKVAGAVLYGSNVPKAGDKIKLPFYLSNARILDSNRQLSINLYPPALMEQISDDFSDTKIFNLSVTSYRPCRKNHMSQWSAAIDKLMFERNLLFIIATGNILPGTGHLKNPGINHHLSAGKDYPEYLFENSSRISNPSQSCFALTVGSVCHSDYDDIDKKSFGRYGDPSAFTRAGLGLWNMVKPDVVEFGGDFVVEKTASRVITIHKDTSPELVKSGIDAIGKDDVGTSYATPKVTHIAGMLQKEFPNEGVLMYRALIAQSARHPNNLFINPSKRLMQTLGYGIPDLQRAMRNTKDRVTFIADGSIATKEANVFKINIPNEVKRPGFDYDILIEVTLSYFSNPRRTRKGTKSYLSTWLDWESSRLGESQNSFKDRILDEINSGVTPDVDTGDGINWKIKNRKDQGIEGIRKQDSTLQKDWAILKSNKLPEEFCVAVIGHKGWETKISTKVPYALTISFEVLDTENELELYQRIEASNIEVVVEPAVQITL